MDRIDGVETPLVRWDLVAPVEPSRTYVSWPTAAEGHPGIFGDPHKATAEAGGQYLEAVLDGLERMLADIADGGHLVLEAAEIVGKLLADLGGIGL